VGPPIHPSLGGHRQAATESADRVRDADNPQVARQFQQETLIRVLQGRLVGAEDGHPPAQWCEVLDQLHDPDDSAATDWRELSYDHKQVRARLMVQRTPLLLEDPGSSISGAAATRVARRVDRS